MPPSVVFHTPPCAAPMNTVLPVASVGSIAIASTRPEVFPDDPAAFPEPGTVGCGPIGCHAPVNGACGGCASVFDIESLADFASCRATHPMDSAHTMQIAAPILLKIKIFPARTGPVGIFSPDLM